MKFKDSTTKSKCIFDSCNALRVFRELDKTEMAKDLGIYGKVDFALPQDWFDKVSDLGINPRNYVWSYVEDSMGEPLNILQKWVETFGDRLASRIYVLKNTNGSF